MSNYIWLFGENLSNTANNNSYYFWRQVVSKDDGIDKFFVLTKTPENRCLFNNLDAALQKRIVWRNSIMHFYLYLNADMFFVTLSFRDVRPEQLGYKKYDFKTETPVIYLQHGTLALKKLGYNGKSFNNNMLRFLYYNPYIKDQLIADNGFKEYQLFYGEFHPRYMELLRRQEAYNNEKKTILWFVTWREYFGNNYQTKLLLLTIKRIISDEKLTKFLEEHNFYFKLCLHSFFDKTKIADLFADVHTSRINWVHANNVDVMDELAESCLLITDYSSVGFDFTFLNKPVIIFTPDLDAYANKRKLYCELSELKKYAVLSARELIQQIINNNYGINYFYSSRSPQNVDYDCIRSGGHIERIYDYFLNLQQNRITFIGYNFYGAGGTVFATRALAEALMEKGCNVQLLSLRKAQKPKNIPHAVNMKVFYDATTQSKRTAVKKLLFRDSKLLSYLKYDKDCNNLIPYCGYALTHWLRLYGSNTIISTRESLHPFLYCADSQRIRKKIYFYHCPISIFDTVFPSLIPNLNAIATGKAVFVTENNRKEFIDKYHFEPYKKYLVLGNSLDSSRMIEKAEIQPVPEKDVYTGAYLLRISSERKTDIDNLLEYGRYLKENSCFNVVINVYGTGDLLDEFLEVLVKEELTDHIKYCGFSSNIKRTLAENDALVDFSVNHSFGMPYIEGILNGKMVFCMENPGSTEVLALIPDAFIRSFEDLTHKMQNLPLRTVEELAANYDLIAEKYSRPSVSEKFLRYLEEEDN